MCQKGSSNLFQILTCTYSLKKVLEAEFFIFVTANNKYLESYDPKQKSKHIMYLGANNLYGYAMFRFFLTSGCKWIDPKDSGLNK